MSTTAARVRVHRVEVGPAPGRDNARGARALREATGAGYRLARVDATRVYLLEGAIDQDDLYALCERLLADPVTERWTLGARPPADEDRIVEVHPLPGVMDPAAQSVRDAASELLEPEAAKSLRVSTGWRYDLSGPDATRGEEIARRLFANTVVHAVHPRAYHPHGLPAGSPGEFPLRTIALAGLDDPGLTRMSREAHLFLSLDEMRAVQAEFARIGRDPTDIELETIAQTWSEHCVHKTLKSKIRYRSDGAAKRSSNEGKESPDPHAPSSPRRAGAPPLDLIDWSGRPGHTVREDGTVEIDNLLKSTVAAATHELIADGVDWTLSVFKDNAGVIAFDERLAVCVKVETHNHPSALEPYGGSATGVGGCIRDVIGTGLGAKPIANTDVFCVAFPDSFEARGDNAASPLPSGCLPPKRILSDVVAGVRDYGNRMGIPTVNGAVSFDDRYVGNPLVFCGCVGVMPRDRVAGRARSGDLIVALGGRTGRDGIHGATFSSSELTDTHADEFAHAVQIGNAIEEKRLLDAILRARDASGGPVYHAITDCGAGGFSSAVGEMGGELGAEVHLDRAPLKYEGLSYTEVWISEAQERMVLAVPPERLDELRRICAEEHVELAVLGAFGTPGRELVLRDRGREVGRLSMEFLHEGLPQPVREAVWNPMPAPPVGSRAAGSVAEALLALLAHPNIASKHWIIRQYDHEVQGNTVLKPLVGRAGRGPGDAAVIEPVPGSGRGLSIACGLATGLGDPSQTGGDPYVMAIAAIDECVRNLVCVGTDPSRIAILDNFCWPSCAREENLASLVRAAEGCYDGAKAYRTPFVSGKDSLNNQFTIPGDAGRPSRTIEIPPTLLITGIGIVPSVERCVTSDAKRAGHVLLLVGSTTASMGGSHYASLFSLPGWTGGRAPDEAWLASQIESRLAQALGPVPASTRRRVDALIRALAPAALTRLDDLVAAVGPRASGSVRRLASLLGRESVDAFVAELGPERVQAVVRAAALAVEQRGLSARMPHIEAWQGAAKARAVAGVIGAGLAASAHDCSDGGLLIGVAEMLIGGSTRNAPIGCTLTSGPGEMHPHAYAFAETPGRYILEIPPLRVAEAVAMLTKTAPGITVTQAGVLDHSGRLRWEDGSLDLGVEQLAEAWLQPLAW